MAQCKIDKMPKYQPKTDRANNLRKLNQNADVGSSTFRKDSDAPIANNAPGVAACPKINQKIT